MTIYLYKKTHNKTGLQYLGKTKSKDPHKYKGSGVYWTSHIKKHGYDVTTEILRECSTMEEIATWGIYYSELWNVVESSDWANLTIETGKGGCPKGTHKGRVFKEEHKIKMRGPRGPISEEVRQKRIGKKRGPSPLKGKFKHSEETKSRLRRPKDEEHKQKQRNAALNRPRYPCEICGKPLQVQHMRKHMQTCSLPDL